MDRLRNWRTSPLTNNVLSVRSPAWRTKKTLLFLAQLFGIGTVRVSDPDVFGPITITQESDAGAVGGIARLAVKGHATGDADGVAFLERDSVQVPQQFKQDRLPIPGDVQGNPGPLIGRELYLAFGLEGQAFILVSRRTIGEGRRARRRRGIPPLRSRGPRGTDRSRDSINNV